MSLDVAGRDFHNISMVFGMTQGARLSPSLLPRYWYRRFGILRRAGDALPAAEIAIVVEERRVARKWEPLSASKKALLWLPPEGQQRRVFVRLKRRRCILA